MNYDLLVPGDTEYRVGKIVSVDGEFGKQSVTAEDGWSLYAGGASFEIGPGMTMVQFGRGIGHPVRGLFIDGRKIWYRNPDEQDQYETDRTYPKTAREALARWDAGDGLWVIECGGIGPGYEQAIHVAAMETIRELLERELENRFSIAREGDDKLKQADLGVLDAALSDINRKMDLGLSGAQAGMAKTLAYRSLRDGWQHMMLEIKKRDPERLILASKYFPGSSVTNHAATRRKGEA